MLKLRDAACTSALAAGAFGASPGGDGKLLNRATLDFARACRSGRRAKCARPGVPRRPGLAIVPLPHWPSEPTDRYQVAVSVMRGYRYEMGAALPTPDDYGVGEPS